jgi:hypothetical protein
MSTTDKSQDKLNDCDCCEGVTAETPVRINNQPGLSAISYRIGTHGQFKRTMLANLSSAQYPALKDLTTRDDTDFTIALLDAWATVADVLTFYQERVANESYLRTATERRSMQHLAGLVGYEPGPGVAASTYLAFTVEEPLKLPETLGSGVTAASVQMQSPIPIQSLVVSDSVTIDIGTKVQTIPGQDEQPQTFETIEKITARAAWNALRPRLTKPQKLRSDTDMIYLKGIMTNLKAGDVVLIITGSGAKIVTWVDNVKPQPQHDRTEVKLVSIRKKIEGGASEKIPEGHERIRMTRGKIAISERSVKECILDMIVDDRDLRAFMGERGWKADDVVKTVKKYSKEHQGSAGEVHAFSEQVGFFGHNAPFFHSLKDKDGEALYPKACDWDKDGWEIWKNNGKQLIEALAKPDKDIKVREVNTIEYKASKKETLSQAPGTGADYYDDAGCYLERTIQGILPESWVLFTTSGGNAAVYKITSTNEKSLLGFGMSAKGTGLRLKKSDGTDLQDNATDKSRDFKVRNTSASVKSRQLELAEEPVTQDLNKGDNELLLNEMVIGLQEGQTVALSGKLKDPQGLTQSELLVISKITHEHGLTSLTFNEGLKNSYERDTVTINANVARATHGETVSEVLGSGDGAQTYQRFTLRQPPLTYVASSKPTGSESTLQVRVNDLLWKEVPTLYGHGPHECIYSTRTDAEGRTIVLFGDGRTGARPPTGRENIRASYRRGIGSGGLVRAGQLSMLMTRPLGLKGAINPLEAADGDDPESIDDIRKNAPTRVIALERTVSLRDYEDVARAFPGIAKALATWIWFGEKRGIFVTVAGVKGRAVQEDYLDKLTTAMKTSGDPHVPVSLNLFRKALFWISAAIKVDSPTYITESVIRAVRRKLEAAFSFDVRNLGQPVTVGEVMAVIQSVPGVIAADIDIFRRTDRAEDGLKTLDAEMPREGEPGKVCGAELLMIDSASIDLREMP